MILNKKKYEEFCKASNQFNKGSQFDQRALLQADG